MRKKMFFCLILLLVLVLLTCTKVDANSETPGDINLDGSITSKDITLLSGYLRRKTQLSEQAQKNADVYVDGKIDRADLDILLKYHNYTEHNNNKYNITSLPYTPKIGDVNLDGTINKNDVLMLLDYIDNNGYNKDGTKIISEAGISNADTFIDEKIDMADAEIIYLYYTNNINNLPYKPILGDINFDGEVNYDDVNLLIHLENTPSELLTVHELNGDVDSDGRFSEIDLDLLQYYVEGKIKSLPYKKVIGDLNFDNIFDNKDIQILWSYLNNKNGCSLNAAQMENAEFYRDGRIDSDDLVIMLKYKFGLIRENQLPLRPKMLMD